MKSVIAKCLVALCILMVASPISPMKVLAETPLVDSKIAFTSDRDGNAEIYVMNADGSNQTRLTNNTTGDWGPAWSPDGARIAFTSDRDDNWAIYVMNTDGSNQARLTNNTTGDWWPAWSPDGTRIAFSSARDGNWAIYVMNSDGSNQTQLTAADWGPAWSPDGSRIAFASDQGATAEIYVMNADGSNQTRLTENPASDYKLAWSPDSTRIAFTSERDGNREIYVINADGSNPTRLTNNTAGDWWPAWSPILVPAPTPITPEYTSIQVDSPDDVSSVLTSTEATRIAFITPDTASGIAIMNDCVQQASALGVQTVSEELFDPQISDFYTILVRTFEYSTDCVVLAGTTASQRSEILDEAYELGYSGTIIYTTYLTIPPPETTPTPSPTSTQTTVLIYVGASILALLLIVFGSLGISRYVRQRRRTREPRYALGVSGVKSGDDTFEWDVFICHATEDKDIFVRQLAKELGLKGLRVWYDEFTLRVGDSLRQSIEKGLAKSRYGIVVLSPNFFAKKWPQDELNGLAVRERRGKKVILPVWLSVDVDYVATYSPMLADRVAAQASDGMAKVISDLLMVIKPNS